MCGTRRQFIQAASASALIASINGCTKSTSKPEPGSAPRRLMINGNMVIPFDTEGALDDATKAEIRATGLAAVKVSIGGSAGTYEDVLEQLAFYDQGIRDNADIYLSVTTADDIDNAYATGRVGIIKSFEAATMFDGAVARISEFAERGVKIMQLGYNTANAFGAGVMTNTGPLGLTELGRQAIATMEASRVLLDLSHAHQQTTLDAIKASTRPVALTHTGCDAINPHPRNKTDTVLNAVSKNGGVVGIYELSYLTPDLKQTPLSAFLAHLQHALNICGEDHVGIGSDALLLAFDTGPESKAQWDALNASRQAAGIAAPGEGPMPFVVGLNGPQRMSIIAEKLGALGYKSSSIDKIMGLNFKRVLSAAWSS